MIELLINLFPSLAEKFASYFGKITFNVSKAEMKLDKPREPDSEGGFNYGSYGNFTLEIINKKGVDVILEDIHCVAYCGETVLQKKQFNYHPYYLSQLIKRSTNQTLHQYITAYRLQVAKKLLASTDDSIATIAWKSGFQSTAYFIKVFKRELGVTPGTYRKNFFHVLF